MAEWSDARRLKLRMRVSLSERLPRIEDYEWYIAVFRGVGGCGVWSRKEVRVHRSVLLPCSGGVIKGKLK